MHACYYHPCKNKKKTNIFSILLNYTSDNLCNLVNHKIYTHKTVIGLIFRNHHQSATLIDCGTESSNKIKEFYFEL